MSVKMQPVMIGLTAALVLGLSACGGGNEAGSNSAASDKAEATGSTKKDDAVVTSANLSDGPDVCFKAIAKHLGADVKVSEINSFFSVGSDIDSSKSEAAGAMTTCSVQYQSPDDPRKLVETRMDTKTGTFSEPRPIEIRVTGGNAAEFKLDDYLIPLSQVNAAGLTAIMDAQKASLSGVFSKYAWSGVRLSSPGPFSNVHTLRLDVDGRLASNDIKEDGYASISVDGKKIVTNHLLP